MFAQSSRKGGATSLPGGPEIPEQGHETQGDRLQPADDRRPSMLKNLSDPKEAREAMLSLLSTAGTLAGIGIALVGIINTDRGGAPATIADDILLLSALGFLVVCYLIFFAVRNVSASNAWRMLAVIDVLFLGSMTLMVLAGFIVVYTLM